MACGASDRGYGGANALAQRRLSEVGPRPCSSCGGGASVHVSGVAGARAAGDTSPRRWCVHAAEALFQGQQGVFTWWLRI